MSIDNDSRFKHVFTHPAYLEQLLKNFVHEPFVNELDFTTVRQLSNSFIGSTLSRRESDLVFSIKMSRRTAYIILELELQSTVDKTMPLRMMRYIAEIYDALLRVRKKEYTDPVTHALQLPPVFPLVLYTGEERWTTERDVSTIIEDGLSPQYIPHMQYYLVALNELKLDHLAEIRGALAAVFMLEIQTPDDIAEHLKDILSLVVEEKSAEVRKVFADFYETFQRLTEVHQKVKIPDIDVHSIMEVHEMYETAVIKLKEKCRTEGWQEGQMIGRQEGAHEKALEDAANLKKLGVAVDTIAKATGLTVEDVEKL